MRRDTSPTSNVFADFTKIRNAKNGKRRKILRKLESRVFERYSLFWLNLLTPELVPAKHWSDVCHEALLHCYTSCTAPSTAALNELERATRPDPYRCPYCLMRQPKTWDHFLAKEDFPEYSTLAPNLVRACDPCNRKKQRNFTNAPRRVVNPYFDPIPDQPLLWCDASVDAQGQLSLLYYVFRDPNVPPPVLDLFERHFEGFELLADMTIEGATIVDTFIQEIVLLRNTPFPAEELDYEISRKLNGLVNYPINSWEVATFEGLRECASFLNYVNARVALRADRPPRINRAALKAALRKPLGDEPV